MSAVDQDKLKTTFFPSFSKAPFGMIIKPVCSTCNLACDYCYYLEKESLYPTQQKRLMPDPILQEFIRQYIESQPTDTVTFVWQGGEPCLAGLEFYEKALRYQQQFAMGKKIENSLQTNGTLLTEKWCEFLSKNNFLVGISIDGPEEIHNRYRKTRSGQPSFELVKRAIDMMIRYKVEFNTLITVNKYNADYPLKIYRYLKSIGSRYLQFLPVVERVTAEQQDNGLFLVPNEYKDEAELAPFTVDPLKWGKFMITIFDEWVKKDVGSLFVQLFDSTLANRVNATPGVCMYAPVCGHAGSIEYNGDVYSCDHFVFPEFFLGNITVSPIDVLMNSGRQQAFGQKKYSGLPKQCLNCEVFNFCYGECPKKRFMNTADGEPGLNYLCEGYKLFYKHVKPYMDFMKNELDNQRPPANVMRWKPDFEY